MLGTLYYYAARVQHLLFIYNCRDDTNPIRADTTLSKADGNITAVAAGTEIFEKESVIQIQIIYISPILQKMYS